MPLLALKTSAAVPENRRDELLASLSRIVAGATGKPEQYVMVTIEPVAALMSGRPGPAAMADVRGVGGLSGQTNQDLSQKICALLSSSLGVPPERVYLNFTDVPAANWGWNGSTFG